MRISMLLILMFYLCISASYAQEQCIETKGEGLLIHGDRGSARLEALAQAKWFAIERAIGVQISSQTLVNNFTLLDDTIIKQTDGIITGYTIIKEGVTGGLYQIVIRACVKKAKASEVIDKLARNTVVSTLIISSSKQVIMKREDSNKNSTTYHDFHSEENPLTDYLNEMLIRQGVEVVSLQSIYKGKHDGLERSLAQGQYSQISHLLTQSLSNIVIIGHLTNDIATEKGRDIGYGVSMPLYRVTSHLSYRILSKSSDGRIKLLQAGKEKGVGMGIALETANQSAMEDITERISESMVNDVIKHIQGLSRQIDIQVSGLPDADADQLVQEQLQGAAWVMQVERLGLGKYRVRYPEKTPYLANTLSRIDGVRVTNYGPLSIKAAYFP